jgi:hypothetical protein
VSFPAVRER